MLFTLFPSFVIGGLTVTNHKALYFISLLYIIVHRLVFSCDECTESHILTMLLSYIAKLL